MKKYNYFCNDCGAKFAHDLPERDNNGFLNDIVCPCCGSRDIYTNNAEGAAESVAALTEYENETRQWEK